MLFLPQKKQVKANEELKLLTLPELGEREEKSLNALFDWNAQFPILIYFKDQ